jgi:hypothetical protein
LVSEFGFSHEDATDVIYTNLFSYIDDYDSSKINTSWVDESMGIPITLAAYELAKGQGGIAATRDKFGIFTLSSMKSTAALKMMALALGDPEETARMREAIAQDKLNIFCGHTDYDWNGALHGMRSHVLESLSDIYPLYWAISGKNGFKNMLSELIDEDITCSRVMLSAHGSPRGIDVTSREEIIRFPHPSTNVVVTGSKSGLHYVSDKRKPGSKLTPRVARVFTPYGQRTMRDMIIPTN